MNVRDYRPRDKRWHDDPDALDAWREGRTGVPIVDAGMRQLLREGSIGLHAQPGAHDRRRVPHPDPAGALTPGRGPLPRPPHGRGRGEQLRQLAVGGGHR
nr:FAD-binding domain-containing protein [Nocardiopsis sp. TSRI0078]